MSLSCVHTEDYCTTLLCKHWMTTLNRGGLHGGTWGSWLQLLAMTTDIYCMFLMDTRVTKHWYIYCLTTVVFYLKLKTNKIHNSTWFKSTNREISKIFTHWLHQHKWLNMKWLSGRASSLSRNVDNRISLSKCTLIDSWNSRDGFLDLGLSALNEDTMLPHCGKMK